MARSSSTTQATDAVPEKGTSRHSLLLPLLGWDLGHDGAPLLQPVAGGQLRCTRERVAA